MEEKINKKCHNCKFKEIPRKNRADFWHGDKFFCSKYDRHRERSLTDCEGWQVGGHCSLCLHTSIDDCAERNSITRDNGCFERKIRW